MAGYALLLFTDEDRRIAMTDDERVTMLREHREFQTRYGAQIQAGDALQLTGTARSLRRADSGELLTDGPFAEAKEALGGFYVVDAADLDEAIAMAAQIPTMGGGVEIRPLEVFD